MESSPTSEPVASPPDTAITAPQKLSLRPVYTALILIFGILLGAGGLFAYQEYTASPVVTSYEECVKARGSVIQESYPATCVTRDGKRFVQPLDGPDTNPMYTDPLSCNTDADCTTGIQSNGCCKCPMAINKQQIGNDGWITYESAQKMPASRTCDASVACRPCEAPTTPVCYNNACTFQGAISPPKQDTAYTCPETPWVDCMPGPDSAGIRWECTDEFLSWAKANCAGFQGAAY